MDVKEVLLPGVGLRFEFENRDGDRIGVVARRTGDFEIVVYPSDDPDQAQQVFRLTDEEAEALAQILGAPRIAERFADLTREVPGLNAGQVTIRPGSPFVDRPLGDTRARTRTGASIVAIVRDEEVLASPGPGRDAARRRRTGGDRHRGRHRGRRAHRRSGLSRAGLGDAATRARRHPHGAHRAGYGRAPIRAVTDPALPGGRPRARRRRHRPGPGRRRSSSAPGRPSGWCCCCSPWGWSSPSASSPAACAATCRRRGSISSSTRCPVRSPGALLGLNGVGILALAGVTYISSSGVIARLLSDLRRLGNRETPAVLSILVLEDFAMAAYLPLLAVLAAGGTWLQALLGMAIAIGALSVAFAASYRWGHHVGRIGGAPRRRADCYCAFSG